MIAVGTNLLVCAHRGESPFHSRARDCMRTLATGREEWALPWPCIHALYAIVTNRRGFVDPTPAPTACTQIETWLGALRVVVLAESARHWPVLKELLRSGAVTGPMVHDARVAALCLQHGVRELWTADATSDAFRRCASAIRSSMAEAARRSPVVVS